MTAIAILTESGRGFNVSRETSDELRKNIKFNLQMFHVEHPYFDEKEFDCLENSKNLRKFQITDYIFCVFIYLKYIIICNILRLFSEYIYIHTKNNYHLSNSLKPFACRASTNDKPSGNTNSGAISNSGHSIKPRFFIS